MKRITLVLMAVIGLSLSVYADGTNSGYGQDANIPVATLSHNGTVSAFYGPTALTSAVSAATAGDTIYLAAGTYTSPETITKALVIRGTNITNSYPTIISGDLTLDLNSANATMALEGVYFNDYLYLKGDLQSLEITKSRIKRIEPYNNSTYYDLITFTQSLIAEDIDFIVNATLIGDVTFHNCVLGGYYNCGEDSPTQFNNCIVKEYYSDETNAYKNFTNCIIYGSTSYDDINANYCAFVGGPGSGNVRNSWNNVSYATLFTDFTGTYSDNLTYTLTASAQTTYIGFNGTQIGIYGGLLPYNPAPNYLQISTLSVAEQSDEDGTLQVEIQLSNPVTH